MDVACVLVLFLSALFGRYECILIEDNDHSKLLLLENDVRLLKTQLSEVTKTVNTLNTIMGQPTFAFMAELSSTITNPASGHQIVFDRVHLNRGNAYNNIHGTFIAPVNGTYHFSLELSFPSLTSPKSTHVHLMKTKHVLAYIYGDGTQKYWIKRSASALVDLVAGDDVYAVVVDTNGHSEIGGDVMHSIFSGFLIH